MKAAFTRHAWQRVLGRLTLTPEQVADMLDRDLVIDIGVEPGTTRRHRLFYSAPEGYCFVAVQDEANGDVITVLPVDYHDTCAWKVSPQAQEQAQHLACPEDTPEPVATVQPAQPPTPALGTPATRFRLMAYVFRDNGEPVSRSLGSWPSNPYDNRIDRVLEDDNLFAAIEERLRAQDVTPDTTVSLYIRLGSRGHPVRISLHKA